MAAYFVLLPFHSKEYIILCVYYHFGSFPVIDLPLVLSLFCINFPLCLLSSARSRLYTISLFLLFSLSLGRRIKKKVEEYEYDISLEPSYRASMLKQFNKTLSEGYFSMILVDAVNSKVRNGNMSWACTYTCTCSWRIVSLPMCVLIANVNLKKSHSIIFNMCMCMYLYPFPYMAHVHVMVVCTHTSSVY